MAFEAPNLDSVTTIKNDGSRQFLFPADVRGKFTTARRLVAVFLLLIYIALPWIKINGFPAVFLDLENRRFHIFGFTFLSTDLWLGFLLLTGLGFSLFFITSVLGRIWCGWACPYTVFGEQIFRRIERWVEGDSVKRRALQNKSLNFGKIIKRTIKHSLYILASLLLAHAFLAYFLSIPRLYEYMQQSPLNHAKAFGIMAFFTVCFYGAFAWFREQFCIMLCPYGRIQSALSDDDTILIGYDQKRGEPRGKTKKKSTAPCSSCETCKAAGGCTPKAPIGDCLDCKRCIQVCPSGIDIRMGLQLECIGCAACIDACNEVMAKVGKPKGLIRYDSLNGFSGNKRRIIRPRVLLYSAFLMLGLCISGFAISHLNSGVVEVTRMPGEPFYMTDDTIRNQFKIRLVSKRHNPMQMKMKWHGLPEGSSVSGLTKNSIEPLAELTSTVIVSVPKKNFDGRRLIKVEAIFDDGAFSVFDKIEFVGPSRYLLKRGLETTKNAATPANTADPNVAMRSK